MSGSEPLLCSHSPENQPGSQPVKQPVKQTVKQPVKQDPENECRPRPANAEDNLKRLSLPVIRIWDELGVGVGVGVGVGPTLWRARQCCDLMSVSSPLGLRRCQSLPSELASWRLKRSHLNSLASYSDSRSNMFSSCSDESVIHLQTTDSLVGRNSDEDRRSPTPSQNGQLRVSASWINSPPNFNSNECDFYSNKNHNCELNDVVNGNVPEPPTSAFTDMLSSLNQQIDVSPSMGKADASLCLNRLAAESVRLHKHQQESSCHASTSTQTESTCRCGQIYQSLLEENVRLQQVVAANSVELARVRKLLETILDRGDIIKGDIT